MHGLRQEADILPTQIASGQLLHLDVQPLLLAARSFELTRVIASQTLQPST